MDLNKHPNNDMRNLIKQMLANGFKINECDKCVYIKNTPNHEVVVCLYVDDMLIISRDIADVNATKRMLASKFDMKNLGVADLILGIRIHKTPQGLALSQSHYIERVLDKFKYLNFNVAKTPIDVSFALQKNEGESDSQLDYARVLGSLMYIMSCTQPDIACAISKLSRFTSNPNQTHWMAMKQVLGYLKHTRNYALHYNKYPAVIEGYSDANWITGSSKVKSTSGYVFTSQRSHTPFGQSSIRLSIFKVLLPHVRVNLACPKDNNINAILWPSKAKQTIKRNSAKFTQGQNTSYSSCTKEFQCGNLGNLSFPFYKSTEIDGCGLCKVDCEGIPNATIELEGVKYQALEKNDVFITLKDPILGELLKKNNCQTFDRNLSIPVSPSITYRFDRLLTLYKCNNSQKSTHEKIFSFPSYQNYSGCHSFILYYSNTSVNYYPAINPLPSGCSFIHLPVPRSSEAKSNDSGLFDQLTDDVTLGWTVSDTCNQCYYTEGRCQTDNSTNNILCSNTNKGGGKLLRATWLVVATGNYIFFLLL
ncbi:uncharacterized protein LOC132066154 [Lycium ferocissimum]|uniref:uncharacterized protein LOC132066154 n=1 Tax=Lycium ferocissimum TaxID=112874 RepID=UPI0028168F36|nr:uncharacterized protein LOC132066154 [Lycium ferocissimum]